MGTHGSLLQAWEAAQVRGELQPDEGQRTAVQRLDALQACLRAGQVGGALRRMLARMAHGPASPCRGVYLWGSVGRGKTWMMDRFHGGLGKGSTRLHFQHFMREVHARLRRLRDQESPLEAVAAQFAADSRVLCLDELQVLDVGDAMLLYGLLKGLLDRGTVLVDVEHATVTAL